MTVVSDAGTPPNIEPDTDPSGNLHSGQRRESDGTQSQLQVPGGVFVIGNHADELTPYVPILSVLYGASGYLNIPCCPWDFDQRFSRANSTQYPLPSRDVGATDYQLDASSVAEAAHTSGNDNRWIESLNLGGDGKFTSSYSAYRIWLTRLTSWCGWEIDTEVLRIPSTRNWALIGEVPEFQMSCSLCADVGLRCYRKEKTAPGGCFTSASPGYSHESPRKRSVQSSTAGRETA